MTVTITFGHQRRRTWLRDRRENTVCSSPSIFTGTTMARAANDIELASYTLFNLGASYTTRIGQHDTTFRASVNNLLDKRYWQYQYENYIKPGDPRSFSVSAKVDF